MVKRILLNRPSCGGIVSRDHRLPLAAIESRVKRCYRMRMTDVETAVPNAAGNAAAALEKAVQELCPGCGLCCDGVLFASVGIANHEPVGCLRARGIPLEPQPGGGWSFIQPCPAYGGNCSIYADRPARCREFHCGLVIRRAGGEITLEAARAEIRETRRQASQVTVLLERLGGSDARQPLSRRCRGRMEPVAGQSDAEVELRAELMLAVHALVFRLGRAFYPETSGPSDGCDGARKATASTPESALDATR
jgi:uncharacterized protein